MTDTNIVDARGLSCPQPVMLVDRAIKKLAKGKVEVLVDSGTARDNVSRLAKNSGWVASVQNQPDGNILVILTR